MQKKKKSFLNIETIITILIAVCVIFLNQFGTAKMAELEAANDNSMFTIQDLPYQDSELLAEELVKYHPDSCKMIEIYDDEFNILFSIQFDETPLSDRDIHDYPDLLQLFSSSDEGQTTINFEDMEQYVYFQWTTNNRGENRLIVTYSMKYKVQNVWVYSFVCYIVLILVFILLIHMSHLRYVDKISRYKEISDEASDEIKR